MKKTILILFAMTLAAGCGSTQKKPKAPPDPAVFEELTAGKYWEYKSNVAGKVINEWQSPDGLWQYGQYVLKRAIDTDISFKVEREIDLEIMRYFKVRLGLLEEAGAVMISPIEGALVLQADGVVTLDRGRADGVREGYYVTVLQKLTDVRREAVKSVMSRYYYERIDDVAAMFVVESVDEHTATLKFLSRRSKRRYENGSPAFTGFPPKWKYEILDMIPYAAERLPGIRVSADRSASLLAKFLIDYFDGDKMTVDKMLKLLESGEPATREVVIEALRGITGREFGYFPEKDVEKNRGAVERWKKWWGKERSSFEALPPKEKKKSDSRDDRLHDRGWGP